MEYIKVLLFHYQIVCCLKKYNRIQAALFCSLLAHWHANRSAENLENATRLSFVSLSICEANRLHSFHIVQCLLTLLVFFSSGKKSFSTRPSTDTLCAPRGAPAKDSRILKTGVTHQSLLEPL